MQYTCKTRKTVIQLFFTHRLERFFFQQIKASTEWVQYTRAILPKWAVAASEQVLLWIVSDGVIVYVPPKKLQNWRTSLGAFEFPDNLLL